MSTFEKTLIVLLTLSVKMHPWHDNWLLLLVKRPNCVNLDHALTECPHDLMLTQVRGATGWKGRLVFF